MAILELNIRKISVEFCGGGEMHENLDLYAA